MADDRQLLDSANETTTADEDRAATPGGTGPAVRSGASTPLELVAADLYFPTSLTFDDAGVIYVAEAGLGFGGAPRGGRIWRLAADGGRVCLGADLRAPVNGLVWHEGSLFVSEGGHPGRISRLDVGGGRTTLLDDLPGPGNYHTNMAAFGPDGKLYFSQGAMTNTGIIGLDAYQLGWLKRLPHAHDLPGLDIVLAGVNVETPLPDRPGGKVTTGAFVPFGVRTQPGQRVPPALPCTAAVMRCNPDGSGLELIAWGLRNAYGLIFLPDGRLLATDQGADDRGSRPVGEVPDLLFEVLEGRWYGWPDFIGREPITDPAYRPTRGPAPEFVLANHAELPPPERPLLRFPPHVAAVKMALAPPGAGRLAGQILVALFGDEAPMTAPAGPRQGRALARIDPADWSLHLVALPALLRPIDLAFGPRDGALYILDFGQFEMTETGVWAAPGSGRLWRLPSSALANLL
jgi:glucose/arabinose dehydrogenase